MNTNNLKQKNTDSPKVEMCEVCKIAPILGIETSACNLLPHNEKEKKAQCEKYLEDLSKGKGKADETLAEVFVLVGEEKMNALLEETNKTIKRANEIARKRMESIRNK